jgi:hypothetical protein
VGTSPRRFLNNTAPLWWFEHQAARILLEIGALRMPDLGGKKFTEDFRTMLQQQVQKAFEDGRKIIQQATTELTDEIKVQSEGAARVIRAETRVIREGFAPTTGNNPPEGGEADPTKEQEGGGG